MHNVSNSVRIFRTFASLISDKQKSESIWAAGSIHVLPIGHSILVYLILRRWTQFSTDDTLFHLCSGTVSGRHERWEFDSGARDLSPEPHTLQKLVEAAAGGTGNMLDLANKVSSYD